MGVCGSSLRTLMRHNPVPKSLFHFRIAFPPLLKMMMPSILKVTCVGCCIMSLYCISFPEAGWRTAFIIGVFVQWLLPKAMALLALPIPQQSYWDKFWEERLRALLGTLGGAALLVDGVTTLGSCGKVRDSLTWAGT
jgi:hypothetical protein